MQAILPFFRGIYSLSLSLFLRLDFVSYIYSLGVLLYELLTGTTPFSEEELRKADYIEMQRVIREQEPPKPSTKLCTLGETLTDIAKYRASTADLLTKAIRGDLPGFRPLGLAL